MKTNKIALSKVHANENNPRTISAENLQLLINSILELPKMLEMRPVVTDSSGKILGGNMRYKALTEIAKMSGEDIKARITVFRSSRGKTDDELRKLSEFWLEWLREPLIYVFEASALSNAERDAFVIKDNVNFGQWDWDALDNFDEEDLQEWGVQSWGMLQPLSAPGNTPTTNSAADSRERIIVIYPKERRTEVEALLRLPQPFKPVYKFGELLKQNGNEDSV